MMQELRRLVWPDINEQAEAQKMVQRGVWVCLWITISSGGLALINWFDKAKERHFSAEMLYFLVFALASFFLYKRSKIAAWTALIVYLDTYIFSLEARGLVGIIFSLIFTSLLLTALRAVSWLKKNPSEVDVVAPTSDV